MFFFPINKSQIKPSPTQSQKPKAKQRKFYAYTVASSVTFHIDKNE
jgi:hypothetical protein